MHSVEQINPNQIKNLLNKATSYPTLIPISANDLQGFNRHMHPRNLFRYHKPNFQSLAHHYPNLIGPHIKKGPYIDAVTLDFTNPLATSALTKAILLDLYGLEVDLPESRLAPTVPQKLNYLHWIQDLLALTILPKFKSDIKKDNVINGLDIGTGCSCIYALLGHTLFGWSFLATEIDSVAYEVAAKNLKMNNILKENITVIKVRSSSDSYKSSDILPPFETLRPNGGMIEFTLCNPPFHLDGEADRRDHHGRRVGDYCETVYEAGGELAFFQRMFTQSQANPWPKSVLIFTTMLGKKRNLDAAMNLLKTYKNNRQDKNCSLPHTSSFSYTCTELCQGKTMRWAIAWSFQICVKLPPPYSVFDKKPYRQSLEFKSDSPTATDRPLIASVYALLKQVCNCIGSPPRGTTMESLELKGDQTLSLILHVDARHPPPRQSSPSHCQSIVTSYMTGMTSSIQEQFVFSCGLKVAHVNQILTLTFDWFKGYNPIYMNCLLLVIRDVITCSYPDLKPNDLKSYLV